VIFGGVCSQKRVCEKFDWLKGISYHRLEKFLPKGPISDIFEFISGNVFGALKVSAPLIYQCSVLRD
jgi:hypothetical protein